MGEVNVFTGIFCPQGGGVRGVVLPLGGVVYAWREWVCMERRSAQKGSAWMGRPPGGQHASYWNAFLLLVIIAKRVSEMSE